MTFTNYDFNINNVKIPNTPDPLGFGLSGVDNLDTRARFKEVCRVKANVRTIIIKY